MADLPILPQQRVTWQQLVDYATAEGDLDWSDEAAAGKRIGEMLALVGATTEYQYG